MLLASAFFCVFVVGTARHLGLKDLEALREENWKS